MEDKYKPRDPKRLPIWFGHNLELTKKLLKGKTIEGYVVATTSSADKDNFKYPSQDNNYNQ